MKQTTVHRIREGVEDVFDLFIHEHDYLMAHNLKISPIPELGNKHLESDHLYSLLNFLFRSKVHWLYKKIFAENKYEVPDQEFMKEVINTFSIGYLNLKDYMEKRYRPNQTDLIRKLDQEERDFVESQYNEISQQVNLLYQIYSDGLRKKLNEK